MPRSTLLRPARAALAALLLAAGGASAAAQEPGEEVREGVAAQSPEETPAADGVQADDAEPSPEEVFFDRVDVEIVNVEVHVTDRRGERVGGLTADDFEILEDGKPVEIVNFYAVEDGRQRTAPPAAAGAPGEVPPPALAPERDGAVPDEQRLHLVVFVDNLNLRPENRAFVFGALRRFVHRHVGPDDLVMVASYDRSVHVRLPFTRDPELVDGALDELRKISTGRQAFELERRQALADIEATSRADIALDRARSHAEYVYHETQQTLRHAKDLIDVLSGLPGRKALLYVSDGLPLVAAEDLYVAVEERFGAYTTRLTARRFDLGPRYRELATHANAGGVTFYPLDARGLDIGSSLSAEHGGGRSGSARIAVDVAREMNLDQPLFDLAEATGGLAIVNTNAVDDALDRVAEDLDTYYSLGYRAPPGVDGRYHRLEVRVRRPGLTVRHREGYRTRSIQTQVVQSVLAALHFGLGGNPLGARLELAPPDRRDSGLYLVPVVVRIPLSEIALIPQGPSYLGRVRVWLGVIDENSDVSPVLEQEPLRIEVPAERIESARGSHWVYEIPLQVRPGRQRLAVGLVDEIGGRTAVVTAGLSVGR